MKAICLALLLVITLQLQLKAHDDSNPLYGKIFKITNNFPGINAANGISIKFSTSYASFNGCSSNSAPYSVFGNNFLVGTFTSTQKKCAQDNDRLVQNLLILSTLYDINGKILTLKDKSGKVMLTL